jgi:hypothetical protein
MKTAQFYATPIDKARLNAVIALFKIATFHTMAAK